MQKDIWELLNDVHLKIGLMQEAMSVLDEAANIISIEGRREHAIDLLNSGKLLFRSLTNEANELMEDCIPMYHAEMLRGCAV